MPGRAWHEPGSLRPPEPADRSAGGARICSWGGNQNGQLGTGTGAFMETRPVRVGIHLTQVSSTASNVAVLEQHRSGP